MPHTVNRNPSRRTIRTFGVTILMGLGVIGALLWYTAGGEETRAAWTEGRPQWFSVGLWSLGAIVCAICLASHRGGRLIYVIWMSAATYIGMVMVPLFLSVLYFVVLPLFALIRLQDPLRKKLKRDGSYWEPHKHYEATLEWMRHPF